MIHLVCVSCSPSSSIEEDSQLFQVLIDAIIGPVDVLIVGDFNLLLQVGTGAREEELLGWLNENAMHQHIKRSASYRTRCAPSLLDFVITKQGRDIEQLQLYFPLSKINHVIM